MNLTIYQPQSGRDVPTLLNVGLSLSLSNKIPLFISPFSVGEVDKMGTGWEEY